MAKQTLEEIVYAENIKNQYQTVVRNIKTHQDDASAIMKKISDLHAAVDDADVVSKKAVLDLKTSWRGELNTRTTQ